MVGNVPSTMQSPDLTLAKALRLILIKPQESNAANDSRLPKFPALKSSLARNALDSLLGGTHLERAEDESIKTGLNKVDALDVLLGEGFNESVGVYLEHDQETLARLEPKNLPLIACTESTIDRWVEVKSGGDPVARKQLAEKLIESAIKDPARALTCSLAMWTCRRIESKKARKLVPLLAHDLEQTKHKKLLPTAILRDAEGGFVTHWLEGHEGHHKSLVETAHGNPKVLRHILQSAPEWLQIPHADRLVRMYLELMQELPGSKGKDRAAASGRLLTLAGSLVPLYERNQAATALLQTLQTLGIEVLRSAVESEDRSRTWGFIQSGTQRLEGNDGPTLSPVQARHLGVAVMRARKGRDALTELESAFINLGGARFGEPGEVESYDATIHNDLDGGLLPGDRVEIVHCGIRFQNSTVVRADVKATTTS